MFRDQYNPKDDPDVHALIKSEVDDYIVNYVGMGEVYRPTHFLGSGRKARVDWVSPYKGTPGHYVITAEAGQATRNIRVYGYHGERVEGFPPENKTGYSESMLLTIVAGLILAGWNVMILNKKGNGEDRESVVVFVTRGEFTQR